MKQSLEENVRQDNNLRQILLKMDGGIMRFWAEHPDRDFDVDLFNDYEKYIIEEYLRANKQNRAIRSLSEDNLKDKSLEWYHQLKGSELKFLVALKPELITIDEELYEQLLKEVDIYMVDAYKETRRRKYAEGIPPHIFYNEVVEKYGPFGISLDCLERVLQEYRGKAVHIGVKHFFLTNIVHPGESSEWEEVNDLQTEFDIRMFIDTFFADGSYKKLRQAVKDMIDNSTQNLTKEESREICREIAKDEMRKFKQFTRWVNDETYPMVESEGGEFVPLITPEERHWLQNIMYENAPGATGPQKLTNMDKYFCHFIDILQDIGKIWAAQLLVHGIDMKELEKKTGIILNRRSGFLYYVDFFIDDQRGDCCVYDWAEAKKLLAKVKYKTPHFKELTWEDEKQCFKNAVLNVMERKKGDGDYLFEKPTQWMAVYRFGVDIGIMYDLNDPNEPDDKSQPQYAIFEIFAKELQFDVTPPTRIPFTKNAIKDIKKDNYVRYNTLYPWSQDGITDSRRFVFYTELENVYLAVQEEYFMLVSQAERSND